MTDHDPCDVCGATERKTSAQGREVCARCGRFWLTGRLKITIMNKPAEPTTETGWTEVAQVTRGAGQTLRWFASIWNAEGTDLGPGTLYAMRSAVEDVVPLDNYAEFGWQQATGQRWRLLVR